MEWIKHLNSSEKKQLTIIAIALSLVIGIIVFIFISIADRQQVTMQDALETAGQANRIDRLAVELSRMGSGPTYNQAGQEVSQFQIQNPIDGGVGDDGSYDSAVEVVAESIKEVKRINQSVDLSNGVASSEYLSGNVPTQPVYQESVTVQEPTAAESTDLTSIKPSLPASE